MPVWCCVGVVSKDTAVMLRSLLCSRLGAADIAYRLKFFSFSVEGKRIMLSAHVVSLASLWCGLLSMGGGGQGCKKHHDVAGIATISRHANKDIYPESFFRLLSSLICSVITVCPTVIHKPLPSADFGCHRPFFTIEQTTYRSPTLVYQQQRACGPRAAYSPHQTGSTEGPPHFSIKDFPRPSSSFSLPPPPPPFDNTFSLSILTQLCLNFLQTFYTQEGGFFRPVTAFEAPARGQNCVRQLYRPLSLIRYPAADAPHTSASVEP
jgi:hypothetical protein